MSKEDELLQSQLEEMWLLVDQLGDLSVRLHRAADAAIKALGLGEAERSKGEPDRES